MMHDRLGDDGAERGHARAEPGRDTPGMERKIGAAGATGHRNLETKLCRANLSDGAAKRDPSGAWQSLSDLPEIADPVPEQHVPRAFGAEVGAKRQSG